MRLSPHLLMNDKNFTVYMSSRPLVNTASELTLAAAGRLPWAARANAVTIPPLSLTTLPANATTRSEDSTSLATARPCTVADSRERG